MITAAAICPAAPLLIAGLADRLATAAPDLLRAIDGAIGALDGAGPILAVTSARHPRRGRASLVPMSVAARRAGFGRSGATPADRADAAIGTRSDPDDRLVPVSPGSAVAAHLLSERPGVLGVLEVSSAIALPDLESLLGGLPDRLGLLVLADGAASHGEHAPGGASPDAAGFDAGIAAALRDGAPDRLALAVDDVDLGHRLLATGVPALATLAALSEPRPARAELLYHGAPFGIGYLVAAWRW